jgi:hypothetical protein
MLYKAKTSYILKRREYNGNDPFWDRMEKISSSFFCLKLAFARRIREAACIPICADGLINVACMSGSLA